jgi:glutamyl-tRNA synthetase
MNTPKQIQLYKALGAKLPTFGHVPMVLGADRTRLSKRHGAMSVTAYRDMGYLPDALLNYLVRLGWSYGDQEVFSLDEMISLFDIDAVNKAPSSFNTEKLLWLNQHYIKQSDPARIAHLLSPHMGDLGIDPAEGPALVEVVRVQQERAKTLVEMAEISAFFYRDFAEYDEVAAKKNLRPMAIEPLALARKVLGYLAEWNPEDIHQAVIQVAESLDLKLGKVAQPLRVAITGRAASPGIDVTLYLVGRDACLRRIDRALDFIGERMEDN